MTSSRLYAVAADFHEYEGWQKPVGVYSTEVLAHAAIGRALVDGIHFAQNLRVVPLIVDAPIKDDRPPPRRSPRSVAMSESTTTGGNIGDQRPNLGHGAEPSIRDLLHDYYGRVCKPNEAARWAERYLAALAAQPVPVREGVLPERWGLAPVEPTAEMMAVGGDEIERSLFANGDTNDTVFDCAGRAYQHMLWAAPPAPETVAPPAGEDLAALRACSDAATPGVFGIEYSHDGNTLWFGTLRPGSTKLAHIIYHSDNLNDYTQEYRDQVGRDAAFLAAAASFVRSGRLVPAPTQPAAQGEPVAWAYEFYSDTERGWLASTGSVDPKRFDCLVRNIRPLYEAPQPAATGRQIPDAVADLCDRIDHLNTVTEPQACADAMDEARSMLLALLAPDRGDGTRAAGDGWKDISTAPKDGTDVLVYIPSSGEQFVAGFENNGWQFAYYRPENIPIHCLPTHWQPLPPPPAAGDREGDGR